MSGSMLKVALCDGQLSSYLAMPDRGLASGVVIVSSIFGVDNDITGIADELAQHGFIVSAPDLFWRDALGPIEVTKQGFQQAMARGRDFDLEQGTADMAVVIDDLKSRARCNGKIGVIGFCFGGLLAFLGAARLEIDAGISFHGSHVGKHLNEAAKIKCPMSFHYGDHDEVAPMEEIERIKDTCKQLGKSSVHIYPGAGHGYMLPSRGGEYLPNAAELSWERALTVLRAM